jgi:AGZA family xanthine/uracil permease-like MFS transporter
MSTSLQQGAFIIAGLLFILALAGLSKHETSKRGNVLGSIGMGIALLVTILATLLGTKTSGAGVAAGGRTGLTAVVVAAGFALALFISPLFMAVPFSAVAPALVMVGLLMLDSITKVDFKAIDESFPAFVTAIVIVTTWRISDGLALGWLVYIAMKVLSGKRRELTATVWAVGAIFAWKMFHGLVKLP